MALPSFVTLHLLVHEGPRRLDTRFRLFIGRSSFRSLAKQAARRQREGNSGKQQGSSRQRQQLQCFPPRISLKPHADQGNQPQRLQPAFLFFRRFRVPGPCPWPSPGFDVHFPGLDAFLGCIFAELFICSSLLKGSEVPSPFLMIWDIFFMILYV